MAKTIVLMASPRLQSNTDILANKIIEGLIAGGDPEDSIGKYAMIALARSGFQAFTPVKK